MKPQRPWILARLHSFRYALNGVFLMLRTQHNAWIHAAATVLALLLAALLRVSPLEWALLILACLAVWVAEALNTALEFLADATIKEFHPEIGKAKDIAAGAVLLAAGGAMAVGLIVFVPYFL
jgi:diacylglycerol kinase (ATP)